MRTARTLWTIGTLSLALALSGCGDSNFEKAESGGAATTQKSQPSADPSHGAASGTSAAGITWSVPTGWDVGPERSMRIATYNIGSGEDAAECAVFYFGPGQGGAVQANIDRWIGQIQQPDGSDSKAKAQTGKRTVNGLEVTTVDVAGTYSGGMGMGGGAAMDNYRMLASIIDAPEGPVFFKMTGPESTVEGASSDFTKLINSVKKQ